MSQFIQCNATLPSGPYKCVTNTHKHTAICPHLTFELGPGSVNCYRYVQTGTDYFAANRTCVRDGGSLAYIENTAEDQYIRDTYFTGRGSEEFWIGLNDLDSEGTFRYIGHCLALIGKHNNLSMCAVSHWIGRNFNMEGPLSTIQTFFCSLQ